jgi:uncharacterized protein with HEPN domain
MSKSELLIGDIFRNIEDIEEFTRGFSQEQFFDDKKTKAAVTLKLLVLGEAVNRLSADLKSKYPQIEWNKIVRSRNIIAHDYEIVDYAII